MSMIEINGVKVNQIKERFLRRFLEAVEKEKHVQRVYLFGSVLEERCTEESDIDFYIVGDVTLFKTGNLFSRLKEYMNDYDSWDITETDIIYRNKVKHELEDLSEGFIKKENLFYEKG